MLIAGGVGSGQQDRLAVLDEGAPARDVSGAAGDRLADGGGASVGGGDRHAARQGAGPQADATGDAMTMQPVAGS